MLASPMAATLAATGRDDVGGCTQRTCGKPADLDHPSESVGRGNRAATSTRRHRWRGVRVRHHPPRCRAPARARPAARCFTGPRVGYRHAGMRRQGLPPGRRRRRRTRTPRSRAAKARAPPGSEPPKYSRQQAGSRRRPPGRRRSRFQVDHPAFRNKRGILLMLLLDVPMQIGHQSRSISTSGTPVARRVRKATGLHRSPPGYEMSATTLIVPHVGPWRPEGTL